MDDAEQKNKDFQEKILRGLPKYQLYEKLNDACENCEYCTYFNFLRTVLDRYNENLYKLFCTFAKNLVMLPELLQDVTVEGDGCKYFNFWIHDEIRKRLNNNEIDNNNISRILTLLLQVHYRIQSSPKPNICYFDYYHKTDLILWKKLKDLYDYVQNFEDIKSKIANDDNLCPIYLKYLTYIESSYEDFKYECCNNSEKCPNNLNLKDWCSTDDFLLKLSCEESTANAPEISQDAKDQLLEKLQEGDRPHPTNFLSHENNHDTYGDGITTSTDYYAKLGVIISFLGILSSFFYLYKFTTFGNWISSKILKQKINANLDQNSKNLLEHDLNNMDESLYNDDYNITYHPS
ncbi:PIR Superfamily Protein [Plasmodium ovale curtisi]|uniref:PIR Superfamily Protein n=1 Tax=Plasmodium ovale curtisi TaxID=864141 RepID=A0A1A8WG53_PLAOA|nr:PIR Superfamily Protein [Plasmodium ovale curtisi]